MSAARHTRSFFSFMLTKRVDFPTITGLSSPRETSLPLSFARTRPVPRLEDDELTEADRSGRAVALDRIEPDTLLLGLSRSKLDLDIVAAEALTFGTTVLAGEMSGSTDDRRELLRTSGDVGSFGEEELDESVRRRS